MSVSREQNNSQPSRIREFLQMVSDVLSIGYLPSDSFFTTDGPDYLFYYNDEIMQEAPITGELIETGDFVDDMDGWQAWIEDESRYDQAKYIRALKRDYDEVLLSYQQETHTAWRPNGKPLKKKQPNDNRALSQQMRCPVCGAPVALFEVCDEYNWKNNGETNVDGGRLIK